MKGYCRHILAATAVLLMTAACTKQPAHNVRETDEITFQVSAPMTKAMFSEDKYFQKEGNRIKIYDFNPSGKYFDDLIGPDVQGNTYGYAGVWPFENAPHAWTVDEHKFFGWLAKDANFEGGMTPESFFGEGFKFDEDTKILTIPAKSMGVNTPQFDFLYSNIETRDMVNNPDYSAVNLEFQHLFTAVSFGASNGTETNVTINEFRIESILNKRAASISFAGNEPVVRYTDATSDQYLTRTTGEFRLNSGDDVQDVFNIPKEDQEDVRSYMMLWPLESKDIHSTAEVEPGADGNVDFEDYPADFKMYIKYTFADEPDLTIKKRMNFPDINLEAGKNYHFDIAFADKTVSLKTTVKNWIHDTQIIDYANSVVNVPGVLTWDDTKSTLMESEDGEKLVVIKNGQPAEAAFRIDTPLGGVWLISLSGDIDAFRVDPDNGEVNASTAHIRVVPLIDDPKREYKVKLKFAIRRPDGRIIAADELVQPASTKRTVVLSPM